MRCHAYKTCRLDDRIPRVAVVDFDVHHGNGTQDIFCADPNVLAVSLHQDQLFPADSAARERNR
ncbi:hypothetical protein AB0L88_40980 [Saccharopolyspora shandongensis]|uniref:hypothetical protein n=1 Tax=Saccharopolyspora shandongensis TaxID=418495 RepID=UPI00341F1FFE